MKTVKISNIVTYSELPSGGGDYLFNSHQMLFKNKSIRVRNLYSKNSSASNLLSHYLNILNKYLYERKKILDIINSSSLLIAYQSWITKSPYFLPWVKVPIIYVCNEPPREFYDKYIIKKFSFKEKIINYLLLYPIKMLDKFQVKYTKKLKLITVSNLSANLIYKAYRKKAKVVYPGIKLNDYKNNIEMERRANQIISVGAINKIKNQMFILEVVSLLPETRRPKVLLIGNGADRNYCDELYEFAKNKGIRLIIKIGIDKAELLNCYLSSLVFIYPSINEPFGLTVLEAMKCGLPIIANSRGGYNEITSLNNGFFLNLDKKNWSDKLLALIKNKKLWKKYSDFNFKYANKFSQKKSNEQFYRYLHQSL